MAYIDLPQEGLDYFPCHYGKSRNTFRGPRKLLNADYVAFAGGTETFGRFLEYPFPALLQPLLGKACVNLGSIQAGPELYLSDLHTQLVMTGAECVVLQVMGAQNLSNRFYSVHPRRNDRFVKASDALRDLYPELDFTEYHFTGHLLRALRATHEARFRDVVSEAQAAWVARMRQLLTVLRGRVILVWVGSSPPPDQTWTLTGQNVPWVTRSMIQELLPFVQDYLCYVQSDEAKDWGLKGMVVGDGQIAVAQQTFGPKAHEDLAEALLPKIKAMLH
jgi:hypothetical protein